MEYEVRIWKDKFFKTYEEQKNWMNANKSKYEMVVVFVNNSFCTEYRKLHKAY